jgi:hypothetical protein
MKLVAVLFVFYASVVMAQRSPYAGSRPEGTYNRVGLQGDSNGNPSSTQNVPIDYRNDVGYLNYLGSLPVDQHPFNFLNAQHVESHRQNPNLQFSPYAHSSHHAGRR